MSELRRQVRPEQPISFSTRDLKLPLVPLFGLAGSGKTAFAGGWILSSEDKANYGTDFFCDVDEGGSDIRLAVYNLKIGKFPSKTPKGQLFEAIIYFKWKQLGGLMWTEVCAPVIDPAGEDVKEIIDKYNNKMYSPTLDTRKDLNMLQKYILDCDAAILIMDVTKAKGIFEKGQSVDTTYKGNPDTESARILEAMMNYKASDRHSRKLRGVFIGLTKADAIREYLPPSMNLETVDGRKEFMSRCFNHTYSKLSYPRRGYPGGIPHEVVPIWFHVPKDDKDEPLLWDDDGTPMIAMDETIGRPHYSYGSFDVASNWLKKVVH